MGKHHYDYDPTPERPAVRLYPHIPWYNDGACWIRDDGQDVDLEDIKI